MTPSNHIDRPGDFNKSLFLLGLELGARGVLILGATYIRAHKLASGSRAISSAFSCKLIYFTFFHNNLNPLYFSKRCGREMEICVRTCLTLLGILIVDNLAKNKQILSV